LSKPAGILNAGDTGSVVAVHGMTPINVAADN
jgi:hypothetical protein